MYTHTECRPIITLASVTYNLYIQEILFLSSENDITNVLSKRLCDIVIWMRLVIVSSANFAIRIELKLRTSRLWKGGTGMKRGSNFAACLCFTFWKYNLKQNNHPYFTALYPESVSSEKLSLPVVNISNIEKGVLSGKSATVILGCRSYKYEYLLPNKYSKNVRHTIKGWVIRN